MSTMSAPQSPPPRFAQTLGKWRKMFRAVERGQSASLEILVPDVCYWHKADRQTALMNVRFQENNGHDAGRDVCSIVELASRYSPIGSRLLPGVVLS
jgi:hypothetical protein